MNLNQKLYRTFFLLALVFLTQTAFAQKGKVEQDLVELRTWVQTKLNQAEVATREERAQLKEQFNQLAGKIEEEAPRLSEKSKEEFKDLKSRYHQWEAKQQERATLYLDKDELSKWRQELLGPHQDIQKISGANMRGAYLTFMTNVRQKRRGWEPEDWAYAEEVLSLLNDRRNQVDASLSTSDRIKIQTLKAEFATFKAGRDAKELYKEMKEGPGHSPKDQELSESRRQKGKDKNYFFVYPGASYPYISR